MKILHVLLTTLPIPPEKYGGTERVVWALYKGQIELGHDVRILVKQNINNASYVQEYDPNKSISEQIDDWADIVHFHWAYQGELHKPFVCTEHGNSFKHQIYPINTIFLSKKHAENHQATTYVHNGLFWEDYGEPNIEKPDNYLHYLAKAEWRIKNIQGAIKIAQSAGFSFHILGGKRFNIRRNPYAYFSQNLTFHGMVGGEDKNQLLRHSKGLIFPVLWHEPFGLAIIESLYLGCPVFASSFGSLPEIITSDDIGYLSNSYSELINAVREVDTYDRMACHQHAKQKFNHLIMSKNYIECYEKVLDGECLNKTTPKSEDNPKPQLKMYK